MRNKLIKNLLILLLILFFLLAGRILLSIGTDSILKGAKYEDYQTLPDSSALFANQGDQGEDPLPQEEEWGENPFHNFVLRDETGVPKAEDPKKEEKKASALKVTCISLGSNQAFAVINGQVKAAGEEIEGYRITNITINEVEIERDGKKSLLKLWDKEK